MSNKYLVASIIGYWRMGATILEIQWISELSHVLILKVIKKHIKINDYEKRLENLLELKKNP